MNDSNSQKMKKYISESFKNTRFRDYIPSQGSYLISFKPPESHPRQEFHMDYDTTNAEEMFPALSLIISISKEGAGLEIYDSLIRKKNNCSCFYGPDLIEATSVSINQLEGIMFHGNAAHRGVNYDKTNIRLHFYIKHKHDERSYPNSPFKLSVL
jgi:hypothetical protein